MMKSKQIIELIQYSGKLRYMSDRELADEIMEHIYGEVKFDKPGLIIDEVIDRLTNGEDV